MGVLSWIVVGLIAGQMMRASGYGLIGDILAGVIGALIGGFLASTLLKMPNAVNSTNFTSMLVAFVGAGILINILRAASGRRQIA